MSIDRRPKQIEFVAFGTLTADQWKTYAHVLIDRPSQKSEENNDRTPKDPRLGEQRNLAICVTCGKTNKKCPGHFGAIELPIMVYNPIYMKIILQLLKCVCASCSRLLKKPKHIEMEGFSELKGFDRLRAISSKCDSIKACPWSNCGKDKIVFTIPKSQDKADKMIYSYGNQPAEEPSKENYASSSKPPETSFEPMPFLAEEAYKIFSLISDDHLKVLGFNMNLDDNPIFTDPRYLFDGFSHAHQFRPESMIWSVLPVLPTIARPWTIFPDGDRRDDDHLTEKYDSIVKHIKTWHDLNDAKPGETITRRRTKKTKADVEKDIRRDINTLINNCQDQNSKSNGKINRSIVALLKGKSGRITSNVGGKRVDFSSRSVITGGGYRLSLDELGVPEEICKNQTLPEWVGSWNIDEIQELVDRGLVNSVCRKGKTHYLNAKIYEGERFILEPGDIADRQLMDGDPVLFNRQPSLRIESMMAFKVKKIKGLAFMLPLYATTPFNADFDGDEMNMHNVQSEGALTELEIIARCGMHIVTPQRNSPVMGIVQDGLVASYLLTMTVGGEQTMVSKKSVHEIYAECGFKTLEVQNLMLRAIQFYPEYITKTKTGLEFADFIPGKLFISIVFPRWFCYKRKTDTLPEYPIVRIKNGIVRPQSGPLCRKIVGGKMGSTIHMAYKVSPELALSLISDLQQITDRWLPRYGFSVGLSDCGSSCKEPIIKALKDARAEVGLILDTAETELQAEILINSALNSAMTIGPILANRYMNKGEKNSLNVMRRSGAKGSVINCAQIISFVGQQNIEGKRMDGTLGGNRCLPSSLPQDFSPEAKGFVEHSYIEGLTPQETFYHAAGGRVGVINSSLVTAETGYLQKNISKTLEDMTVAIDGSVRNQNGRIVSFVYGDDGMDPRKLLPVKGLKSPFFIDPLFLAKKLNSEFEQDYKSQKVNQRALTPRELELLLSFIVFGGNCSELSKTTTHNTRTILSKLLKNVKVYESVIPKFCLEVRNSFFNSMAYYGLMAGLIAASSLGEPATQMVLNTFHMAGISGKDASLGVPRYRELMNATQSQKTPGCIIRVDHPVINKNVKLIKKGDGIIKDLKQECKDITEEIGRDFEEIFVRDIIVSWEMQYTFDQLGNRGDPLGILKHKKYEDPWWVKLYKSFNSVEESDSGWIVLLKFDVDKLYERDVDLKTICHAIEYESDCKIKCIASPEAVGMIAVYVDVEKLTEKVTFSDKSNICSPITTDNVGYFLCRDVVIDNYIINTRISGINKITKTYAREDIETKEWFIDTDGSNLVDVLSMPNVDQSKTISDDMHEIYKILGIEAAREFLVKEIQRVISFDGTYVNPRHIGLLADVMTLSGHLTPVSRHGIGREVGPCALLMFEKSVENAMESCAFGEKERLESLASSVMYGRLAKSGPGVVDVEDAGRVKM